jgi:hypothetical protein
VAAALVAAVLLGRGAFAQAVSPLDYSAAPVADLRLGVALATLGELADAPALLERPSSQQFVDDTFAEVAQTTNDSSILVHTQNRRNALRAGDNTFDRSRAYGALADLMKDVLRAAGSPRNKLIALGFMAEQTAYNARVLRDPATDSADRAALGANAVADTLVPDLPSLRAQLAALGPNQWSAAADAAEKIVAALLGSSFAVPFASSPAVWLVLVRTRPTNADKIRRAQHYWLDIVRYDGTHQTIGAYPDGKNAFDRDARRLLCGLDQESDEVAARTIPVQPGPGTTSAQLAVTLVHLCDIERLSGIRYDVKDADDDRVIADILFRAGVSVAPILRAAAGR